MSLVSGAASAVAALNLLQSEKKEKEELVVKSRLDMNNKFISLYSTVTFNNNRGSTISYTGKK